MSNTINVMKIIRGTTVDGPGFRTSIYFAGCLHNCEGCHNPSSWDFNAGTPMTFEEIEEIILEEDFDVTLTGGDPLYNPQWVIDLADLVHSHSHSVWLYTGYKWEEIVSSPELKEAVYRCDVVVDSPFVLKLRDTDLLFKGSLNQRIIDVKKSIDANKLILWER